MSRRSLRLLAIAFFLLCGALPSIASATYYLRDDSTGGDCTLIGAWDAATRTCTLGADLQYADRYSPAIVFAAGNVTFDGAGHALVAAPGSAHYGIGNFNYAGSAYASTTIRGIRIEGFQWGIFLDYGAANALIEDVEIRNSSWAAIWARGHVLFPTSNVRVIGSRLFDNYIGIRFDMAHGGLAQGNLVVNSYDGITSYACDDSVIADNVLQQATYPMTVLSNRNVIHDNVVEGTVLGGQMLVQGNDNQFFHNNFIAAPRPNVLGGTGNVFNLPAPQGGNYWGDFPCTDANSDGFCDSPVVFSGGSDQLPLATPTSGWLAADVTPPVTHVSFDAAPGNGGWLRSAVTVTLTATDDSSGVARTVYSVDGGGTWNTSTGPFVLSQEGTTTLQFYSVDVAGNAESIHSVTLHIDMTPPFTSSSSPAQGSEFILNQPVLAAWSVSDPISGICSASAPVPNGAPLDTSAVGARTFPIAAEDCAGNSATVDISWAVRYAFGGFVAPVDPSGSSIFNLGRPVPIRFSLTDYQGVPVSAAVAELFVAKVSDAILGTELQADSMAAATSGNLFWYDPVAQQYVFVLDTRPLARGTWQLRIALDDGSSPLVNISLQ